MELIDQQSSTRDAPMELQASLRCIHLYSPQPEQTANFYAEAFGMSCLAGPGAGIVCAASGRRVGVSEGPANKLRYAHFVLDSAAAYLRFEDRVQGLAEQQTLPEFASLPRVITLADPDGNLIVFTPPVDADHSDAAAELLPATLQHFALRTPNMQLMMDFYRLALGFTASDLVRDEAGGLRACFLRSDALHYALALFLSPVACFDHQSFETPDWGQMKQWGDHMAALRAPIVWGIGRHGPGNDLFFMVRDPDGNLAEISTEIERCEPGRPAGLWPHEERTLNLWGKAIMRS